MKGDDGPSNPILRKLIRMLRKADKKSESPIWGDLAERLNKSNRSRAKVNISQLNRYTEKDETVVVPGKVLGAGKLDHPLSVAAFNFSERAEKTIKDANGEKLSIDELLDKNPNGKNVKIME